MMLMETAEEAGKENGLKALKAVPDLISPDNYERRLTAYELERLKPYRPSYIVIDGTVTNEYTALGAWAHTIPGRRTMCILPPERRDPYLPIEVHEALHNLYPNEPEEVVHAMAFDKSRQHEARSRAIIRYR